MKCGSQIFLLVQVVEDTINIGAQTTVTLKGQVCLTIGTNKSFRSLGSNASTKHVLIYCDSNDIFPISSES